MTLINSFFKQAKNIVLVTSIVLFSSVSYADVTPVYKLISKTLTGNECGANKKFDQSSITGFGGGFSRCAIRANGSDENLAFVIGKFNSELSTYSESKRYDDEVAGEHINDWGFTISSSPNFDSNGKGNWVYTATNGYPEVTFWAAKASNKFNLFWYVEESVDCSSKLSYSCMSAAEAVTEGSWKTPKKKSLSHLTFFGGVCLQDCEPNPNTEVPEPSSIAIFALALGVLRIKSKRRNS